MRWTLPLNPFLIISLPLRCTVISLSYLCHLLFSLRQLKLKPLPNLVKHVFLGPKETLLVILPSPLSYDQDKELIRVLSKHKGVIGWPFTVLKGISPTICIHRIHLEDNAKHIRQMQCRLNPGMKKLVQKDSRTFRCR